jgi:crotonobetainyl-CoA:carnitine CoA-transferase CaiB-like acyl-CoA transferase
MVEHPELGDTLQYPGAPAKMKETPWKIYRRAPLIGEHNEEVYEKELGLSKEDLAVLKANGVI